MNVTSHTVLLSKSIVIEKSVIAIESTIMSQLVRYTSLFLLILVSVLPHSFGQCPDFGFASGRFSITGTNGGTTAIGDGNGSATVSNNTALRICEGESIVLAKTAPTTGTVGGVNYWLVNEALYNSGTYTFPSNSATSFANYDPSSGGTNVQVILSSSNLPGPSSPSPYKYSGAGRYLLIQKDNSYSGGSPDNYYACQVIEIVSPTITKPNFTAASCVDGSVVVSLPADATRNIFYNYAVTYKNTATGFIEGSANSSNNPTYEYKFPASPLASTTSKNIEVSVTGQTQTGGCSNATDSKTVTVKSAIKPRAGLIIGQATNGSYNVEFVAETGVKREVFLRDATSNYNYTSPFANFISGTPDSKGYEAQTYTVPNPDKQYCFIARAVDNSALCPTGNVINSDVETCTTTLKVTTGDKKNDLTWSPFVTGMIGGVYQSYEILREGTALPIATITSSGTITYSDDSPSLVCGTKYKYTVKTVYGAQSISSPVEVEFKQTTAPAALDKVFVSVSDDNSFVTIDASTSTNIPSTGSPRFNYYRTSPVSSATTYVDAASSFKDTQVNTTKEQYCYYMTWNEGACIESTPSNTVCTILLKKTGENLTWTPETPMSMPKGAYNIDYAPDPNSGFTASSPTFPFNAGTTTSYDLTSIPNIDGQEFYLRIVVRPLSGSGAESYSNYIYYDRPTALLLPQIFTPNNDAVNETFDIQGRFIRKTKMWIYDRWGSPIFYKEENSDKTDATGKWVDTGWDGTLTNGQKAPEGTYVYKIQIEDSNGRTNTKSGALIVAY